MNWGLSMVITVQNLSFTNEGDTESIGEKALMKRC